MIKIFAVQHRQTRMHDWKSLAQLSMFACLHSQATSMKNLKNIANFSTIIPNKNMINTH
jgi:hypothetical protein